MTSRRLFLAGAALALVPNWARAETRPTMIKIGLIRWDQNAMAEAKESLKRALRKRGYVENVNVTILYRSADQSRQRADQIIAEFVREAVQIIVASATPAVHAAHRGTSTIPIVMAGIADPVASGLVPSIARPGGNITGISLNLPGLAGKRVEVLRDAFPALKRIAFLGSTTDPATRVFVANTESAARTLGVTVHFELIETTAEFESAFARIAAAKVDAVIVQPIFYAFAHRIGELALKFRLPTISDFDSFAQGGGLLSYGPDRTINWDIVTDYVDKILRGAKPGDLPIQEPTRFRLVVNLKTAKALGVTISPFLLGHADSVIR